MTLGNKPTQGETPVSDKTYWWLSIGRDVMPSRYFDNGWRAFEFIIMKPFKELPRGESHPTRFRFAFVFWLPFYMI